MERDLAADVDALKELVSALYGELAALGPETRAAVERALTAASSPPRLCAGASKVSAV
jgi:hypothetical protein